MNLQIRLGQYTFTTLRPLNQTKIFTGEIIPDAHIFQFFRIAQAIKIKMVSRWLQGFIGLHQRVGRAFYSPLVAKPAHDTPADGGFTHTKITIQVDNHTVARFSDGSR